jgi:hypothetical protein
VAVLRSRKEVAPGSEVLGNRPIGGEEALRVPQRFEPLHASLPLAGRLTRVFSAIVKIAMLPMFHARQHLSLRRAMAFQLVCDEHPWDIGYALEQLPEESLSGVLVPPPLYENIQNIAVLIHGPPQIVAFAIDREKNLIQVPCIPRPRPSVSELIGEVLTKPATPLPHRLVRQDDAVLGHELFNISQRLRSLSKPR